MQRSMLAVAAVAQNPLFISALEKSERERAPGGGMPRQLWNLSVRGRGIDSSTWRWDLKAPRMLRSTCGLSSLLFWVPQEASYHLRRLKETM